ncbi:MAG: ABC transporter ATP-binding protein [Spirochaetaceae bacterium]|nr:MAG: ABC transporter ATP-binding protein [Spirochaetaceae bacterium]
MLEIRGLDVWYRHIHALDSVDLSVRAGEITALIGANGAGKTSLLNTISGLVAPRAGSIELEGSALSRAPHRIVRKGVVHVPEGRHVFAGLTVQENLLMGAYTRRKGFAGRLQEMYRLFPRLEERKKQQAGTLSGGEQQMLAICRGLISEPRVLLMDEPSLGLAPLLVREVFELIQRIRAMGITVLLVEQNAMQALAVADHAYVLENGSVVLSGTGGEVLADPNVRHAYLGAAAD